MKMQSSLKGKTNMRESCASFSSLALWDTLGHLLWGTRATNTLSLPFASLKKSTHSTLSHYVVSRMYLCAVFMRCVFAGIDWTIVFWNKSVGPIHDGKQKKTLLILHQDPKKQLITFVNMFSSCTKDTNGRSNIWGVCWWSSIGRWCSRMQYMLYVTLCAILEILTVDLA